MLRASLSPGTVETNFAGGRKSENETKLYKSSPESSKLRQLSKNGPERDARDRFIAGKQVGFPDLIRGHVS